MPTFWEAHHNSGDIISLFSDIKEVLTLNTISLGETAQIARLEMKRMQKINGLGLLW